MTSSFAGIPLGNKVFRSASRSTEVRPRVPPSLAAAAARRDRLGWLRAPVAARPDPAALRPDPVADVLVAEAVDLERRALERDRLDWPTTPCARLR
jgi:hypothetical protein